jgi:hypothetical protein
MLSVKLYKWDPDPSLKENIQVSSISLQGPIKTYPKFKQPPEFQVCLLLDPQPEQKPNDYADFLMPQRKPTTWPISNISHSIRVERQFPTNPEL